MKTRKNGLYPRLFYRTTAKFSVEFYIMKYKRRNVAHLSGKKGLGQGQDIGEGGLSFVSPYLLPVDMIVRLAVELPENGVERMLARVVRSERVSGGYLTGVQFFNLANTRQERIRNFVVSQAKKQYNFLRYL
jgi:c-di-GMP-binding flagellar brake protein YcgR